jgi:predicted nucleic acid-binding protein
VRHFGRCGHRRSLGKRCVLPLTLSAMKTKQRPATTIKPAFWDTSAIVPLCCFQAPSAACRQIARLHPQQVVWWATPLEAVGALQRLTREGHLSTEERRQFLDRLDYLRAHWHEVQPTEELRSEAERLLRVHPLRSADALQLAAALAWCNRRPRGRVFIAGDKLLSDAASLEGFTVAPV